MTMHVFLSTISTPVWAQSRTNRTKAVFHHLPTVKTILLHVTTLQTSLSHVEYEDKALTSFHLPAVILKVALNPLWAMRASERKRMATISLLP